MPLHCTICGLPLQHYKTQRRGQHARCATSGVQRLWQIRAGRYRVLSLTKRGRVVQRFDSDALTYLLGILSKTRRRVYRARVWIEEEGRSASTQRPGN